MAKITKLFGLAGSGKTHEIAKNLVERTLKRGYQYSDMLSISFTKAAGQSLRERCAALYADSHLAIRHRSFEHANIRTLHSFCHEYFLKKYFGELEDSEEKSSPRGRAMYFNISDFHLARVETMERSLSKLRLFSYKGAEEKFAEVMDEIKFKWGVLNIQDVYNDYMEAKGKKFDYCDVLEFAITSAPLQEKWKYVSIDEAQDFSPIHWKIVERHIFPCAEEVLVAGDPTQSIHVWAGADPKYFLEGIEGEKRELYESRRIPDKLLPSINALQRQMTDGTDHFQIVTQKTGGSIVHMGWPECVIFLKEQSDERKDTLVLSLSGFKLAEIGRSLIDAGVLFMQDRQGEFSPWSPTVTKSDWHAYSLYYFIWHKMYDARIEYGKVWRMVESSRQLSDIWSLFADPSERDKSVFTITVKELMEVLKIDEDLNEFELLEKLFEWPPRRRKLLSMRAKKDNPHRGLLKAHHRILEYIRSCGEGPYVEPVIKLSTVHGAKGLEADTVVLLLTRDELRSSDDKRKLCINAICRSKDKVILTWLNREVRNYNHLLHDKNLCEIMTDEEFSKHLDARWGTPPVGVVK